MSAGHRDLGISMHSLIHLPILGQNTLTIPDAFPMNIRCDDERILSIGNDVAVRNFEVVLLFHDWLLSTDRLGSTIDLRMRHITALSQSFHLLTVTVSQLESVLMRRRHLAPETRKSELSSWRVFFGWAHTRGLRGDNPAAQIESIRIPVRVPRLAPDDRIREALARATPHERAMICLARFACLRLTELTTLHTRNRQGDRLIIRGKGDKERVVYLNDDAARALDALERVQGRGHYFPGLSSEHMHPQSVNKIITRRTGCNPHSLRHAGATAAYRATGDLRGVQDMLGHASLNTTQRYLHLDDDSRRRVAAGTSLTAPLYVIRAA